MRVETFLVIIFIYSLFVSFRYRSQPKTRQAKQQFLTLMTLPLGTLFCLILVSLGAVVV